MSNPVQHSRNRIIERTALVSALLGAAACLWIGWCEYFLYAWNEIRLAPTFALKEGINPYPGLHDGPLFTWIYGPIGLLVNLPVALASSLPGALRISAVINAILLLGPIVLLIWGTDAWPAYARVRRWLALALCVLLISRFELALYVSDHCAIAAGLVALWLLGSPLHVSRTRLCWVAAVTTLAIWSKQIAVFLVVGQCAYLWISGQRRATGSYAIFLAVWNGLALLIFSGWFGFSNLWLNMVVIPGRLGWADFLDRLALRPYLLVGETIFPAVGLLLLRKFSRWPGRQEASGRWFQLGVCCFAAMLPIGLVAFFKVGGDANLLHCWYYIMPVSIIYWLARESTVPLRIAAVTATLLLLHGRDFVSLPREPFDHRLPVAENLCARFPNRIWFPQNPLVTYFADHRIWHSEDGVSTRFLAGFGIKEQEFKRWLPPHLDAVVYPSVNTQPFSLPLLPEYSKQVRIPYWKVFVSPKSVGPAEPPGS